jgi:hypothetical protein
MKRGTSSAMTVLIPGKQFPIDVSDIAGVFGDKIDMPESPYRVTATVSFDGDSALQEHLFTTVDEALSFIAKPECRMAVINDCGRTVLRFCRGGFAKSVDPVIESEAAGRIRWFVAELIGFTANPGPVLDLCADLFGPYLRDVNQYG